MGDALSAVRNGSRLAGWHAEGLEGVRMRVFALLFAALVGSTVLLPASAANNKQVQNMKGQVSYQRPNKTAKPIASQASIVLGDNDITITGIDSLAAVTLPDSSRVLVGADSKVQLAFFNQTDIANANFVVYQGKFRFRVEHPSGAKANYTFQTPTAQIGVRGTEGDIGVAADGTLTVNVYDVSNPDLPVVVDTKDGKHFTINKGQSFVATYVNGILQEKIGALEQQLIDQFSPDFGVPSNWAELQNMIKNKVLNSVPHPCPPFIHIC
jgi:hypothetical protein